MPGCVVVTAVFVMLTAYSPRLAGSVAFGVLACVMLVKLVGQLMESPRSRTRAEVAAILRDFLENPSPEACNIDGSPWDDFTGHPIADSRLDEIRTRCANIEREFPPEQMSVLCSEDGMQVIRAFLAELEDPE